jgi:8-oxo-dGTP pyrophosphatase MutT (NUDIX family)
MAPENLRQALIEQLAAHHPEDDKERVDLASMRRYAETLTDPFSRDEPLAHFTASAMVVSADGQSVCFVHHKKLERWLQPGGHVEAGETMAQAALREAREETNLEVALHPRCSAALDVDVHVIPARAPVSKHEHLDVRFLVIASSAAARHDPAESLAVSWFSWDAARALASDPALVRLLEKAERLAAPGKI